MTRRQRVLSAIAHPNVAYLLLSLGMLGLTIELWTPGAVLPGVAGGISLLLAFFALQILPVNYVGLLLIGFGVLLLVLELKVTSYGLLTAGGLASFLFGSMILMDSDVPELRVSPRLVLPIVLAVAGIAVMLVRLARGVAAAAGGHRRRRHDRRDGTCADARSSPAGSVGSRRTAKSGPRGRREGSPQATRSPW